MRGKEQPDERQQLQILQELVCSCGRSDRIFAHHSEARAISSLNHSNICTLYDVGPNYLVMELVEGEAIAARLKSGPLDVKAVLLYASQIVETYKDARGSSLARF
jgi:serine/threonine protein kinase